MSSLETASSGENWLLLTDYASKYRISVSTLRRRIKGHQIQYRFEGGRYLLLDETPSELEQEATAPHYFAAQAAPLKTEPEFTAPVAAAPTMASSNEVAQPTLLLNELKRAYTNILQEKEEQLIQLKEEVSDLKTLVRVLESDNDRMRKILMAWDKE